MSWHYLREVAGESLEDICLGGEPLPPLKSKTTHAEFYCKGKLMDSYLDSLSGMTFAPLMESPGEVESMSSAGVFPVRTSPLLEKGMDLMGSVQDSGHTWRGWLAKFDPLSCSWRTAQCSLLGEEHELLQTLPKWGMTRHGLLWELPTLAHRINGTGCGLSPDNESFFHTPNTTGMDGGSNSRKALRKRLDLWPTPVHSEARQGLQIRREGKKGTQTSLSTAVLTWPTPVASDISMRTTKYKQGGTALSLAVQTWPTPRTKGMCGGSGSWDLLNKNTTVEEARLMGAGNGGQLNPPWVEWLMGWPIGWTDLKPLGMDKSPPVPLPPGDS